MCFVSDRSVNQSYFDSATPNIQNLYEEDFVLWVDTMVAKIKQRDLESLDWKHLLEEIESLGSEQRHKIESYLLRLLIHLLQSKLSPEVFPETCPFSIEQILDFGFLP